MFLVPWGRPVQRTGAEMTYFLCIAGETTGLGPDAKTLELGWLLFDPITKDERAGGIHYFMPEGVDIEPGALEVHERTGLLDELAEVELSNPADVLAEIKAACAEVDGVHIMLYWGGLRVALTNDGLWDEIKRGWPLDFATANEFRAIFTGNPSVHPAMSRVLPKLAAMRQVLNDWKTLFKLAVAK